MNKNRLKMEISRSKISLLASLQTKKKRSRHQLFIVEGEKCVNEMLGAFDLVNIVGTEKWMENNALVDNLSPDVFLTATSSAMRKISTLSTAPEVVAVFRMPQPAEIETQIDNSSLHLLLDGIQDPGNMGTIIRTADWFGFKKIYASKDTVDIFNPKTIQSTMGSLKRVKVVYGNLEDLIIESGIKNIYGTMLEGEDISKTYLDKQGLIIMGNEGNGLSEGIRKLVNRPLLIPPFISDSHAESLNVGVATGIVLAKFRSAI